MCGITAILALTNRHSDIKSASHRPLDLYTGPKEESELHGSESSNDVAGSLQNQINNSLDTIKHRGPDSHGSWISDDHRVGMSICCLQDIVSNLMLV